MRQRITFIQDPEDSVAPGDLQLSENTLTSKGPIKAAREDKVTFGFSELLAELKAFLEQTHEAHVRWISPHPFPTVEPFVSRLSPGLHVFYTPLKKSDRGNDLLCATLNSTFGALDTCETLENSFTPLPAERFSSSAAFQFYSPLPSLETFVDFALSQVCPGDKQQPCLAENRIRSLLTARTLDLSFDVISRTLDLSAFWPPRKWPPLDLRHWNSPSDRMEVGILSNESPLEVEELQLAGALTVVGEDSKPSATLFSFPSRHHKSESTFSFEFLLPTGLHPKLQVNIADAKPPLDGQSCSLHAHLTLPKAVFADKYQLDGKLFLASHNLSEIHHVTPGVDLEAPIYAVPSWGSTLLLSLARPTSPESTANFTATIPLHLRYLHPNDKGMAKAEVPYPAVFWACVADEGSKFPVNPFDRINLGYDGLFGPKTMFYHLSPVPAPGSKSTSPLAANEKDSALGGLVENVGGRLFCEVDVPVLDMGSASAAWVELGTAAVVFLGFVWVLWSLRGSWPGWGVRHPVKQEKKTQ